MSNSYRSLADNKAERCLLPQQGLISCTLCWRGCDTAAPLFSSDRNFRLENFPAAYGGRNPTVLILGMTKGETQTNALKSGNIDRVPFKNCERELAEILTSIGVMSKNDGIFDLLRGADDRYAFGSVVRCTLMAYNAAKRKFSSESKLILPVFKGNSDLSCAVDQCISRFLSRPPSNLKLIILLGNDDIYIELMRNRVRMLHTSDFCDINEVSYHGGGVYWVHAAHPSGANRGNKNKFVNGDPRTPQGRKKAAAEHGVKLAVTRS